jgi:hypothetical protein
MAAQRARDRKFADSLLEEAGFEPSVPRDTTKLPKAAQFASARPNFARFLAQAVEKRWYYPEQRSCNMVSFA